MTTGAGAAGAAAGGRRGAGWEPGPGWEPVPAWGCSRRPVTSRPTNPSPTRSRRAEVPASRRSADVGGWRRGRSRTCPPLPPRRWATDRRRAGSTPRRARRAGRAKRSRCAGSSWPPRPWWVCGGGGVRRCPRAGGGDQRGRSSPRLVAGEGVGGDHSQASVAVNEPTISSWLTRRARVRAASRALVVCRNTVSGRERRRGRSRRSTRAAATARG